MNKVLDVGSGPNKTKIKDAEVIGLDHYPFEGVDVVRDIRRGIPFSDDTFDGVLIKHCLEHFANEDVIFIVEEIWRVCKPGGAVYVEVPDATSPNAYLDPTHKSLWYPDSFRFWAVDDRGEHIIFRGPAYGANAKFKLEETGLDSNKSRFYRLQVIKQ
jgi:SAM-dependent methyltransferase